MQPRTLDAGVVRRGLAILWMSIRSEPRAYAVATLGAFLYAAMTVGSAVVFGWVTDAVVTPAFEGGDVTSGMLVVAASVIVGVAVLKAAGIVVRKVGATFMQARLQARARKEIAEQYQRLPLTWHQRHPTGELLSRADSDVEATFWPIGPLPLSTGVVFMLVIAAIVLVLTDPVLALVGFVLAPAIAYTNARYNRRTVAPATRAQERRADVAGVAHESFDGALVVKTLGREAEETERFRLTSDRLRDELIELGRLRALYNPVVEGLPNVGVLAALVAGAWRASAGVVSIGDVVLVSYLFTILAFPIRVIGFLFSEFPRSVVGWQRVRHVLDATDQLSYGPMEASADRPAADVDLEGVTFHHEPDDPAILRELSLAVGAGRTIAVVGPTGAGKSTIAALLARLADPDRGAVRLDGQDLRHLRHGNVARNVAVVFQDTFLFDDSIRENITLGEDFGDEEIRRAAATAQALGYIEALPDGFDTVIGERGTTLSGGQRQRLALARALVRRPRVLVLDDATSSVDARVEAMILEGLRDAALPSTVILVAYRESTVSLADEVVFLREGRVRARGSHAQLVEEQPEYRRLLKAYETRDPA